MGKHYRFKGVGLNKEESKRANKLFNEYKANYNLDNFSDLQLLEELVYRETKQDSYKRKLGELTEKLSEKKTTESIIPKAILTSFNDNLSQILILKEKLGLFEEKKEKDEFKAFQVLEKKFEVYKDEHIEEFDVDCPFCGIKFFLNRRTDKYQPSKLKLFKNKVLCNSTLWRIYKEKKITKEEFAEILNVSPNYVDWLEEKIYSNPSK